MSKQISSVNFCVWCWNVWYFNDSDWDLRRFGFVKVFSVQTHNRNWDDDFGSLTKNNWMGYCFVKHAYRWQLSLNIQFYFIHNLVQWRPRCICQYFKKNWKIVGGIVGRLLLLSASVRVDVDFGCPCDWFQMGFSRMCVKNLIWIPFTSYQTSGWRAKQKSLHIYHKHLVARGGTVVPTM